MTAKLAKTIVVIGGVVAFVGFAIADSHPFFAVPMMIVGLLAAAIAPIAYEQNQR